MEEPLVQAPAGAMEEPLMQPEPLMLQSSTQEKAREAFGLDVA